MKPKRIDNWYVVELIRGPLSKLFNKRPYHEYSFLFLVVGKSTPNVVFTETITPYGLEARKQNDKVLNFLMKSNVFFLNSAPMSFTDYINFINKKGGCSLSLRIKQNFIHRNQNITLTVGKRLNGPGTYFYHKSELFLSNDLMAVKNFGNRKNNSRHITKKIRDEVWKRDEGKCRDCGSNENLEFDHIIPHSKGGANTKRNIQLLCEICNRQKSDKIG